MKTHFAFIDESGRLGNLRDPFYIKSCFIICAKQWRDSRNKFIEIKKKHGLKEEQEFKWAYIWALRKHHGTKKKISKEKAFYPFRSFNYSKLMEFVDDSLSNLIDYSSVRYLLTISPNKHMSISQEKAIHKMHIQEIMQRIEMELQDKDDLGILFHDEMSQRKDKIMREMYNELFLAGDFIRKYSHIRDSIAIEISSHSYGIQIADFLAGAFMGFMKDYDWSLSLFKKCIAPKLRKSSSGYIFGYGIREVPHSNAFRGGLIRRFNEKGIS